MTSIRPIVTCTGGSGDVSPAASPGRPCCPRDSNEGGVTRAGIGVACCDSTSRGGGVIALSCTAVASLRRSSGLLSLENTRAACRSDSTI